MIYRNKYNVSDETSMLFIMGTKNNELVSNLNIPDEFTHNHCINVSCYDELYDKLEYISYKDCNNNLISTEGFYLRSKEKPFIKYKIQTKICTSICDVVNTDINEKINIHQTFLNLYKTNKLSYAIPFLSDYCDGVINRISTSMKTLSKEILNMYDSQIVKTIILPNSYTNLLYSLLLYNTSSGDF